VALFNLSKIVSKWNEELYIVPDCNEEPDITFDYMESLLVLLLSTVERPILLLI
jgi:hypothetical protein